MAKRKTADDYRRLGETKKCKWLGPEVPNTQTKTWWQCASGHKWATTLGNFRNWGCPHCSGNAPKTLEDYRNLAASKSLRWLGPEVPNVHTKTEWKCLTCGYCWWTKYHALVHQKGCPRCSGRAPKMPSDYEKLGKENGFDWLGPFPSKTSKKTKWRCPSDHIWDAPLNRIQQGHGCPYCAKRVPKIKADYFKLAQQKKLDWIGEKLPRNTLTKTKWKCHSGHIWTNCFSAVQKSHGCPFCSGNAPKTTLDYEQLAISRSFKWHGPMVPNSNTSTVWECEKGKHRWSASYSNIKFNKSGCPQCASNAPLLPDAYHALGKKVDIYWLGPHVPNTNTNTQWECKKCGNHWLATYANISQGSNCPACANENRRLKPDDYFALAEKNHLHWIGGPKCPSNNKLKTLWQCEQLHKFSAAYHTIQQNRGCPQCADMVNGVHVSQPQKQLQEMLGGNINYPCGSYRIDIALVDEMIAIEYDCWFWHGDKQEYDMQRDADLLAAGWKILHVKTNRLFPSQKQIKKALVRLKNGEKKVDIILSDWGKGLTFMDRYNHAS